MALGIEVGVEAGIEQICPEMSAEAYAAWPERQDRHTC